MDSLRAAGFTSKSSLQDVAHQTGLTLDEVRRRAGVGADVHGVSEEILDRSFSFPDFFRGAGNSKSADLDQLGSGAHKSAGLGLGNSGAGGMLRLKLDEKLGASSVKVVADLKMSNFPHRGEFIRAAKEEILKHVATVDEGRALAAQLGHPGTCDSSSLLALSYDLAMVMVSKEDPDSFSGLLRAAVNAPPKLLGNGPSTVKLPAYPGWSPDEGRWLEALMKAFIDAGVDTAEKLGVMADRLGARATLIEGSAEDALFHLLGDMVREDGSDRRLAAAVAEPIEGKAVQPLLFKGTLPARGAHDIGPILDALLAGGLTDLSLARDLGHRLGIGDRVGGNDATGYLFNLLVTLEAALGAPKADAALTRALAEPLTPRGENGLPLHVDAPAIRAATTDVELISALLQIASSRGQLAELARRLDVYNQINFGSDRAPFDFAYDLVGLMTRDKSIPAAAQLIEAALT